jgi:hypothetical protein
VTSAELPKQLLTQVGRLLTPRMIHRLNAAVNYLEVGRWFATRGFVLPKRERSRFDLFDVVAAELARRPVTYLEFGVWEGATMRYWSRTLRHEGSVLHGFDSFEGLPEDWRYDARKSEFSTAGVTPRIDDTRVTFHKGWFESTLPTFVVPSNEVLFITLDADLYSSTRTVLTALETHIQPGTYLYFDEFSDRQHELRAFDEFLDSTGFSFRVVGATRALSQVIFQRVS